MKLSDAVGHSGLALYTEVAMLLFIAAFLAIVIRTFMPSRQREHDEASRLPLQDDATPTSREGTPR
jgi:cbb3-type cytochrome oxidase subunit 3